MKHLFLFSFILLFVVPLNAQTSLAIAVKAYQSDAFYQTHHLGATAKVVESPRPSLGLDISAFSPMVKKFYFKLTASWQQLGTQIAEKQVASLFPVLMTSYKEHHYHHFISTSIDFGWRYRTDNGSSSTFYLGAGGMLDVGGKEQQTFYYQDETEEKILIDLPSSGISSIKPFASFSWQNIIQIETNFSILFEPYFMMMLSNYAPVDFTERKYYAFGINLGVVSDF